MTHPCKPARDPEQSPVGEFDPKALEFMLLEFESQRDMRTALNSLVASETNIYVAIVAATFLALAFIGQFLHRDSDSRNDHLVLGIAFGSLMAVFLLGCAMYNRVVSSRITVVKYARNMNRVRNYFVRSNIGLGWYVSSDVYDDSPPFGAVGSYVPGFSALQGNTGLIAILNSSSVAAMIGIAYYLLDFSTNSVFSLKRLGVSWGIVLIVASFTASIFLHHLYQRNRYQREETR